MSSQAHTHFFRWLLRHWVCAFVLMGLSFVSFGVTSFKLVEYFSANFEFLSMYGLEAVQEGGLRQLAQLVVGAYFAIAFWLLFKICEQALVQRLSHEHKE